MNNVVILNYKNIPFDTGIPLCDVEKIFVHIISGDEILAIYTNSGDVINLDSSSKEFANNYRNYSFYDGSYLVMKPKLEEWNKREETYEWLERFEVLS